ncbi:MAG TPA: hypothetical protein PK113_04395, partial [Bacillota bacterium]|nr:hypothetical protein [Bacillota bacterium]
MKLHLLKDLYTRNNIPEQEMQEAMDLIMELNNVIEIDIDAVNETHLDELILYLVKNDLNSVKNFVVLMRYFRVLDRKELFIHLTKYTGMLNVMESIIDRLKTFHGEEKAKEILGDFKPPYLGTPPMALPDYVNRLMVLLDAKLKPEETERVLAGNNHHVPKEAMIPEKVEYENSHDFESYLKERHARKVKELKEHYEQNKVWFEQIITPEVIDFVASNQEVLSGVLKDETLYITKIPYDTLAYLNALTETDKKYYACHCPFAREAVKAGKKDISGRFCYCSAGFAKFPFEIILDQELKIKVLNSVLMGDDFCRFSIDMKDVEYKR